MAVTATHCKSCRHESVRGHCVLNVKKPVGCIQWERAPGGMSAEQRQQYHAAQPKPIQEVITQE